MGLFDKILSAVDNPEQEASADGLGSILDTVQQLASNHETSPTALQSAMSIVGNYTRSALQEKSSTEGEGAVEQIISQFGGTQANNQVVQMLFNTPQMENMLGEVGNKTGIPESVIQTMLPTLVPLVLNFLKTGSSNSLTSNPILRSFLDADGDGDVDLADAMQMMSKHLNR